MRDVVLTTEQFHYLRHAGFLSALQCAALDGAMILSAKRLLLSIPDDLAEEFRDAFTSRLMAAGFDSEYQPNDEGSVLEDLIDRFFIGALDR
ncbi:MULTISPECIES: hypothetical protein [unclassified Luteibacter]|uniref:hypothetical protein n=1 Tax=Luteibacter sp. PvP019 TaxID=3156436 RepID=UPI0033987489